MHGQGLLITPTTDNERKTFNNILRNSIGAINSLQKRAENILEPISNPNPNSQRRAALPPEQQTLWDEMQRNRIENQRWSDGLVSFVSLGDADIKCNMNGVYGIFGLAGTLCLLGLASGQPIRAGIEIAWGVELHPGELYGPAVARAYELESEVAQYPRVVVGQEAIRFLETHAAVTEQNPFAQFDREMANLCLNMLAQDTDGHWILHYLGDTFLNSIIGELYTDLYKPAHKFILDQLNTHKIQRNTKLAFRYSHLLRYFDANRPDK